jgi:hypothetical protein
MTRPTSTLVATLAVLVAAVQPVSVHQLDEYLQATRIVVAADRIGLEIGLTPGVAVAPAILAWIDRDGDGQASAAEVDAYVRRVLQDVVVSVDGRAWPLSVTRADCPPFEDLRAGTGTIRVDTTVDVRRLSPGRHAVRVVNTHATDVSVYLVNALVPSDPAIAIAGQRRDVLQHGIDLDVEVARPYAGVLWGLVMFGGFATLAIGRVAGSWRER